MSRSLFAIAVFTAAATGGLACTSQAAPRNVHVPVIRGAKSLSAIEKGGIAGLGRPAPIDSPASPTCCPARDDCDVPPPPPDCDPPPPPPTDCPPPDTKPGYGFGTTGHYGPPGQGFTSANSWRIVVAGGGTRTPKGRALPPRAFR